MESWELKKRCQPPVLGSPTPNSQLPTHSSQLSTPEWNHATDAEHLPTRGVGIAALIAAGCAPVPYGFEQQQTFYGGRHPTWAVAPAVNLSGETQVDPILQADLLYHQLAKP